MVVSLDDARSQTQATPAIGQCQPKTFQLSTADGIPEAVHPLGASVQAPVAPVGGLMDNLVLMQRSLCDRMMVYHGKASRLIDG